MTFARHFKLTINYADAKRLARQGLTLSSISRITRIPPSTIHKNRTAHPQDWPPVGQGRGPNACTNCDLIRLCSHHYSHCETYLPDENHRRIILSCRPGL